MVDNELQNYHLGRILICIKIDLDAKVSPGASLFAYIVFATVNRWAGNGQFSWYRNG